MPMSSRTVAWLLNMSFLDFRELDNGSQDIKNILPYLQSNDVVASIEQTWSYLELELFFFSLNVFLILLLRYT